MERYYQPEIECASREQIRQWQSERLASQVQNVWDNVPLYRERMKEAGLEPGDIQSVDDLHKLPIRQWQSERLASQVQNVWDNVPLYRERMKEAGLEPGDIQSVDDLHKLPFITKEDLREAYPYGLLARPLEDCVRIQSTSGTTGRRVVAFYTQHDIDLWEDCCARAITAAGGTKGDVCHVSYGYGLFTGGPGLNGGSHKVGCLTLPMSSGNTERQIQFMKDLGSTLWIWAFYRRTWIKWRFS